MEGQRMDDGKQKTSFEQGTVKNIDLWKRLLEAKKEHDVVFHWVKGHAGVKYNEICDQLCKMEMGKF